MSDFESCDKCKYVTKSETEYPCNKCKYNAIDMFKPMTNADRIRNMTDEELYDFLYLESKFPILATRTDVMKWLQSEAKESKAE